MNNGSIWFHLNNVADRSLYISQIPYLSYNITANKVTITPLPPLHHSPHPVNQWALTDLSICLVCVCGCPERLLRRVSAPDVARQARYSMQINLIAILPVCTVIRDNCPPKPTEVGRVERNQKLGDGLGGLSRAYTNTPSPYNHIGSMLSLEDENELFRFISFDEFTIWGKSGRLLSGPSTYCATQPGRECSILQHKFEFTYILSLISIYRLKLQTDIYDNWNKVRKVKELYGGQASQK